MRPPPGIRNHAKAPAPPSCAQPPHICTRRNCHETPVPYHERILTHRQVCSIQLCQTLASQLMPCQSPDAMTANANSSSLSTCRIVGTCVQAYMLAWHVRASLGTDVYHLSQASHLLADRCWSIAGLTLGQTVCLTVRC